MRALLLSLCALSTLLADEPDVQPKPVPKQPAVTMQAFADVEPLPAGGRVHLLLRLDIRKDLRLPADPPQPEFLKRSEITLASKQGTKLGSIIWPKHEVWRIEDFDEPIHVHTGRVDVRCTLDVPIEAAGKGEELAVTLSYLPIHLYHCQRLQKVTVTDTLKVAAAGEPVKKINTHLFP